MYTLKGIWVWIAIAFVVWLFVFAGIKATMIACVVCWLLFGCGIFPESWYAKIGDKVEEK